MPKLTIATSNRDRLDLSKDITKFFLKSLESQTNKDFELLIADGGSKNYEELKTFFDSKKDGISIRIVQEKLGEKFERAKLNNVGVRNARTPYIMTTDVDLFFGSTFVDQLINLLEPNVFIESRTMYWKAGPTHKIHTGQLDPFENLDKCKIGRVKKRTSAGGCQCTSIENWNKLRGFNESMIGWGSEDVELLKRATSMGLKILWTGESIESINVFHQHHSKISVKDDLECQEKNKMIYFSSKQDGVNLKGWGGVYEGERESP